MGMSHDELSLLLFFETAAVDRGGVLESARMNAGDFAIAKRWNESGFVRFGRIAFKDINNRGTNPSDHWCVLSEEAWIAAHAERRSRSERLTSRLTVARKGIDS